MFREHRRKVRELSVASLNFTFLFTQILEAKHPIWEKVRKIKGKQNFKT